MTVVHMYGKNSYMFFSPNYVKCSSRQANFFPYFQLLPISTDVLSEKEQLLFQIRIFG